MVFNSIECGGMKYEQADLDWLAPNVGAHPEYSYWMLTGTAAVTGLGVSPLTNYPREPIACVYTGTVYAMYRVILSR